MANGLLLAAMISTVIIILVGIKMSSPVTIMFGGMGLAYVICMTETVAGACCVLSDESSSDED